ncbi:sugar transporter STL1 [Stemphylium lycopersici]|uniref:Sugar transporter STL1 n=1 Tax=Stemphylium lycopersici TaxID=183478 RepID=A0A364MUA5_STELY|nr:hypothetical protein TW65_04987 [Stemphylium lycopersici]RAQ98869.1 sugar transporter STL1 [Stemphylium lycopersici]RAR03732.1 sugar transporter STL1 [Stemphylium lycopersici]
MASNHNDNPWEDQRSQQQGYQSHNPYQAYQDQPQNPYAQQSPPNPLGQHPPQEPYAHPPLHQDTSPWGQEGQETGHTTSHNPHNPYAYGQSHETSQPSYYQQESSQPSYQNQSAYPGQEEVPPGLPPRRTATEMALPTGQDRSHQIEVMQSYEAAGRKDDDDDNVEVLQREFPKLDGSLIAAIYGDSKSLSATREMLQALE